MTLVYTFDKSIYSDISKVNITKDFYKESISRALKLGYRVEMYSNDISFESLVDRFFLIESHFSVLWDSFKFIPLRERNDSFILIDGDVFLNSTIPIRQSDIVVDTVERGNWNILYNRTVKKLTNIGVKDIIPEWEGTHQDVLSCGILYFNDLEFRNLYTESWFKLNKFILANKSSLNLYEATPVAAQYLLTVLARHYNKSFEFYSHSLGVPNTYYVHHAGKDKLRSAGTYSSKLI